MVDASWAAANHYAVPVITGLGRDWQSLRNMINQVYAHSMFGTRNFMVDTCGSWGKLDEELCTRWMQTVALMPMVRNYYQSSYVDEDGKTQATDPSEFWAFTSQDSKNSLLASYALRQKFSIFIYSSIFTPKIGALPIVAPLFAYQPVSNETLRDPESSFIVGGSLRVTPVLD
jgi:alpha-glucosidase (family GH31 glycosyl hydrolase)